MGAAPATSACAPRGQAAEMHGSAPWATSRRRSLLGEQPQLPFVQAAGDRELGACVVDGTQRPCVHQSLRNKPPKPCRHTAGRPPAVDKTGGGTVLTTCAYSIARWAQCNAVLMNRRRGVPTSPTSCPTRRPAGAARAQRHQGAQKFWLGHKAMWSGRCCRWIYTRYSGKSRRITAKKALSAARSNRQVENAAAEVLVSEGGAPSRVAQQWAGGVRMAASFIH